MNRPVATRAIFFLFVILGLGVAAAVFAAVLGEGAVALGIGCGSALALACGLSWILGALLTFDGPMNRLLRATLGLGPVRMVLVIGGICSLAVFARGFVDLVACGSAFAGTHLLLQIAEADTFMKLADASSKYPPPKPLRFGGLKIWR